MTVRFPPAPPLARRICPAQGSNASVVRPVEGGRRADDDTDPVRGHLCERTARSAHPADAGPAPQAIHSSGRWRSHGEGWAPRSAMSHPAVWSAEMGMTFEQAADHLERSAHELLFQMAELHLSAKGDRRFLYAGTLDGEKRCCSLTGGVRFPWSSMMAARSTSSPASASWTSTTPAGVTRSTG